MNAVFVSIDNLIFSSVWNMIDFIYISFQDLFAYNFFIKASNFTKLLNDNTDNVFLEIFSNFINSYLVSELFYNIIFDNLISNFFFIFEFSEDNFRRFIGLIDFSLFSIYHPEAILIRKNLEGEFIHDSAFSLNFLILDFIEKSVLVEPINFFIQILTIFFLIVFFAVLYLSFFSKNKEELQLDTEYLIANTSTEAEKELFAIDDAVHGVFFLVLLFGTYFGFLFIGWSISFTEISIFFMPLLFVFYFILLVPFNLLYDFGFFFIAYLRGASNTSSLFFEFIYDYIGIIAFFTRLLVQFVRLVLMFVVYCMMHDTVMLQNYSQQNFLIGDSFIDELCSVSPNGNSIMFFLFVTFPLRLMYWLYECLHTFFVVTVQFSAFFTIIFWLFLLFYTFFIFEKYEHHFNNLNRIHNDLISELKNLK